jgi:hypothetical protein
MCPEPVKGTSRASTSAVLSSSKGSARMPLCEMQLAASRLRRLLGILVAERH